MSRGTSKVSRSPACTRNSAPTMGEWCRAGEITPASVPAKTCTIPPCTSAVGTSSTCWNWAAPFRVASGRAAHNCAPFRAPECRRGVCSACAMPPPAVITFTPPGLAMLSKPRLSSWTTSPSSSHVTVWRPMCGCGATSIGLLSEKESGPKRSRKHHGPTRRRSRTGSTRAMESVPVSPHGRICLDGTACASQRHAGFSRDVLGIRSPHERAKCRFRRCHEGCDPAGRRRLLTLDWPMWEWHAPSRDGPVAAGSPRA